MVPLVFRYVSDPRYPDFLIPRIQVDISLEPTQADLPVACTYFEAALIDSAAGYLVIPYKVHRSGLLKIHQELGAKPYRILGGQGPPHLQRFAEVGIRFLVKQPDGGFGHWPTEFIRVKAYLLDEATRPKEKVLLGLDALLENFITHLEKDHSFLQARDAW